jgi:hypothetical protein
MHDQGALANLGSGGGPALLDVQCFAVLIVLCDIG